MLEGNRQELSTSPVEMSSTNNSPSLLPTAIDLPVEQKLTVPGIEVPDPVNSEEVFARTFSLSEDEQY